MHAPLRRDYRELRAGVVGAGAFGRHHAAKYSNIQGVSLTAVADASAEVRARMAETYGAETFADWRDMLGKVDIVSICSPAVTHAQIVRAFLIAGTHVLVEKPIATNLDEADELIALARAHGLVLTVGHQERYVFLRSGLLGQSEPPLEINCWRTGPWTGRGDDVSVTLDLMIHDLDLVHRLIPDAVFSADAFSRTEYGPHADEVTGIVTFENGAQARLHASRVAQKRRRGMKLTYRDGSIEIDFMTREIRNTTPRALPALDFDDPLGESVLFFMRACRGEVPAFVRAEEARLALETALAIDDAARAPMWRRDAEKIAATA